MRPVAGVNEACPSRRSRPTLAAMHVPLDRSKEMRVRERPSGRVVGGLLLGLVLGMLVGWLAGLLRAPAGGAR